MGDEVAAKEGIGLGEFVEGYEGGGFRGWSWLCDVSDFPVFNNAILRLVLVGHDRLTAQRKDHAAVLP